MQGCIKPTFRKFSAFTACVGFGLLVAGREAAAAPDPNFHIYLAFGQSNMEGNATPEAQDKTGVDPRFQMMAAVNWNDNSRKQGNWYTAVPPICRPMGTGGLNPCDYFGRTLVDSLPAAIKVGIINVSVAGCAIEMFDEAKYQSYIAGEQDWMKNIANQYGGNPYGRLVEVAKLAQQDGVIKGFLLHQGESGSKTGQWANEVKTIYNNLIRDLGLNADKTPLLVGDLVRPSQMIQGIPNTLPQAKVISSQGLTERGDGLHFDAKGYREFGRRYAQAMLQILADDPTTALKMGLAQAGYAFSLESQHGDGTRSLRFALPHRSAVTVNAYSLGGVTLARLVSGEFGPGAHTVNWNENAWPAGAAFLRFEADADSKAYSATRSLIAPTR